VKEHPVITESVPPPVFGRDGEPCPSCGAPLAGDQRYCLHCGTRRPEARLEFLDVLDADVQARGAVSLLPPAVAGFAEPPPRGLNARLQANSGVLALTALLLVTLLIGLLVGHWATGSDPAPVAASAPAPQVIRVEGTAAPAATSATPAATPSSSTPAPTTSKSSSKSDASTKPTAPKDSVSVTKLSGKKAVDDAVKKGTPITTGGGKLPPKDDKAPGGGSAIEDIG
jgi:hypothetical protein